MLTHDPSIFSLMAADHDMIIIIAVHHKIDNLLFTSMRITGSIEKNEKNKS